MSNTANWSYQNSATIKPYQGQSEWGGVTYGPEYTIACTWAAVSQQERDDTGAEFVSRFEIFTEDGRPKMLDMIRLNGDTEWQEIRGRTWWDMSFFGETPDYRLVT
ncbi:hypothetical protein [Castellaniella sp.]|uniref:hypothetical protein n=1 Tax=Castellaniella sp. TaxID=1955812 RepID=UPI002AFFB990|nr:hypothetical protein [Castellaniella sp.]